ncbi:MAG: leucyl aminopeptidase [Nitrospirae bacterium]|nr:leucyl aminopeptidase [Nitrospirota bacterium]
MNFFVKAGTVTAVRTEALALGVWEGEKIEGLLRRVDQALRGLISEMLRTGEFEGKSDQFAVLHTQGALPAKRLILIGLGKRDALETEKIRQASGSVSRKIRDLGLREFTTSTQAIGRKDLTPGSAAQALAEGAFLGLYRFSKYRVKEKNNFKELSRIQLVEERKEVGEVKTGVRKGEIIAGATCFSRDLVNHPANDMTPTILSQVAVRMASKTGVRCRVLAKREVQRLGMGAFLGVARGSEEPPKFIILEYWGGKRGEKPIVVVGKSITFDSGGISIKPSEGMEKMKYDMSGGAATLGLLQAAAQLRLPVNLVGLLPATENLPSGTATKPGDVLKSMGGWTIEVVNTDAEGRLVLADALSYALRYKPAAIIDIATLTGACVVALGSQAIGMIGNNEELKKSIRQAGEETRERVWEMPLWDEYHEQIRSPIADIKNTGGREGGMITAAAFLSKFVEEYPWVHLDIAGVAWKEKDSPYIPKGGVGVGVRLLVQFLQDWGQEKRGGLSRRGH